MVPGTGGGDKGARVALRPSGGVVSVDGRGRVEPSAPIARRSPVTEKSLRIVDVDGKGAEYPKLKAHIRWQ